MGRSKGSQAEISCRNWDEKHPGFEEEAAEGHTNRNLKGLSKSISICKNQYISSALLFQSKHTNDMYIH